MVEETEAINFNYLQKSSGPIAKVGVGVESSEERLKLHQQELQDLKNQLIELKQADEVSRKQTAEAIDLVNKSIAEKTSQMEDFESSLRELETHSKRLSTLKNDLASINEERMKLESELESAGPVVIIQRAHPN